MKYKLITYGLIGRSINCKVCARSIYPDSDIVCSHDSWGSPIWFCRRCQGLEIEEAINERQKKIDELTAEIKEFERVNREWKVT